MRTHNNPFEKLYESVRERAVGLLREDSEYDDKTQGPAHQYHSTAGVQYVLKREGEKIRTKEFSDDMEAEAFYHGMLDAATEDYPHDDDNRYLKRYSDEYKDGILSYRQARQEAIQGGTPKNELGLFMRYMNTEDEHGGGSGWNEFSIA